MIALLHGAGLILWWLMTPKGFPVTHGRFWVNSALPFFGLIVLFAGILGSITKRPLLASALAFLPGFWLGIGFSAPLIFSTTGYRVLYFSGLPTVALLVFTIYSIPRSKHRALSFLLGSLIGFFTLYSQRAPAATTRSQALEWDFPESNSLIPHSNFASPSFQFQPQSATVTVNHQNTVFKVKPLLTFVSRSPDGFWTVFASRRQRGGSLRQLSQYSSTKTTAVAFYRSDMLQRLTLELPEPNQLFIESRTKLTKPIFSHLNSDCHLSIETDKDLFLRFSSSPNKLIKVKPFDYPTGRPARMAYFQRSELRVVEASSGEKGPFKELVKGPLKRGEALVVSMIVEDKILFQFELTDWSAEASTDLSPTAGWGLPMNAIEFSRSQQRYNIWISLAASSVGRGWDSVGHSPGDYRGGGKITLVSKVISESSIKIE